jgi:hypothetical protein
VARARDKGDATTAARRVLFLAGAVAGLWLVSWWLSGHAQAATREVNPIGEVVAGVLGGPPPGGAGQAPKDESRSAAGVVAPVAGGVEPVSQVARGAAPVVEPVSRTARSAAPVVEPVSQVVRAAAPVVEPVARSLEPVVEPVSQVVRAAAPVVEPVVRAVAPVAGSVVRSVEPVLEPVSQVVDPVLDPVLDTVAPVTDSVGSTVEPITDVLAPVTEPIGDTLAPVVEPIVAPGSESAGPSTPDPSTEQLLRQARQAKAVPTHQATVPATHHDTAPPLTAPDRTYDRPGPATSLTAATPRQAHRTHPAREATPSQPVRHPGNAPAPRSPAPDDAACGAAPTIPPAFLTSGHGPRATHAFTPSHGDFLPLWRACEPGTGPG